jgi:hypothetical protein
MAATARIAMIVKAMISSTRVSPCCEPRERQLEADPAGNVVLRRCNIMPPFYRFVAGFRPVNR